MRVGRESWNLSCAYSEPAEEISRTTTAVNEGGITFSRPGYGVRLLAEHNGYIWHPTLMSIQLDRRHASLTVPA